jgi:transcriptional regulator with XRE-family HTH domain
MDDLRRIVTLLVEHGEFPLIGGVDPAFDELSGREEEYYRKPPFATREDYRKGQLVQPEPGRPGFMEGKLVTQGKHKGEWVIYHSSEGTQYFKSKKLMDKWIKERPGKGDSTLGKRSQHPDFPRPTKGKILPENAAKLKKLKELIKNSNSSYTKNLTAHEILVKAGWKGGYQDIGTYQKIRPEVVKAMKKFQTTFEKMDNYVTNVMLAEDALVKDFRNPQKHLAEKFGVSRGTVDNWANGTKSPLASGKWKGSKVWAENKKLFKHLGKELSFNKYKSLPDGTPRLIWDMSEIIQNKLPTAFAGPGEYLPHKFIMDSAHRHNKYTKDAGKSSQVRFIDKNYELLPRSEWKFIKGDKLYSMDPALDYVVYDGTTYKNNYLNHVDAPNLYKNDFGDVYRAFDDLDTYMNTKVPDPKNPKKQILLDTLLRRQAYDETGKQDFLKRRFAELDHFDGVDKNPFSNIRLLDRQTNERAGIIKRFDKYKKNPQLLNKTLTDMGYLNRDKDVNAFIKRMSKKATFPKKELKEFLKLAGDKARKIPPQYGVGMNAANVIDDALKSGKFKGLTNFLKGEGIFMVADYLNNISKGQSNEKAWAKAVEMGTFDAKGIISDELGADEKAILKHAQEQGASEQEVIAIRDYLNYMKKFETYQTAEKMLNYAKKNLSEGEGTGDYMETATSWKDVTDAAQKLKLREKELGKLQSTYLENTEDMKLGMNMLDKYMKSLAAQEWNKTAGTWMDRGARPNQGEGIIWGGVGAVARDIGAIATGQMPTNFWDWVVPAKIEMRNLDEIVKDIKTVLEEKVAPSVAAHNGSIGFIALPWTLAWLL